MAGQQPNDAAPLGFHEVAPGVLKMNGFDVYAHAGRREDCTACCGRGKVRRCRCEECSGIGRRWAAVDDFRERAGLCTCCTDFATNLDQVRDRAARGEFRDRVTCVIVFRMPTPLPC
jgi:hypothetical protein